MTTTGIGRHLIAVAAAAVTVLVVGYLAVQIDGMTKGYLVGLSGSPTIAVAKRFPWELEVAMVLIGFAAFTLFRRFANPVPVRRTVLGTLIVLAVLAGTLHEPAATFQPDLVSISLIYGGTSAFTMALIAGILADLVARREDRPVVNERPAEVTSER